jgi:tetratricopeptide (TPR) repeat protein
MRLRFLSMRHRNVRCLGVILCVLSVPSAALTAPPDTSADEKRLVRIPQAIQSGDLRGARSELQELFKRLPGDPRIYNLLGVIDARENNFAAAESNFQRAIQLAPRFTGAYLNLGRLYQEHANQKEEVEKALKVYRELLEFEPDHVEANYQAAWLFNRQGQFVSSLERLARLPADAQQRAPALALRCADNAAVGRRAQADVAIIQLSTAADLTEADVLPILPVLHDHHADDLATRLLEALTQRGLGSKVSLQALAGLEEKQSRFKQARASLEKDLQLEPPSVAVLTRLAKLAYQAGDLEGAAGYLAHARDLEPENAAVHFFFGMVCIDLKLPPEAKQSLKEAVRLDPDNPFYHYAFGAVLLQEKKSDEAIPHFRKYRDARPDDPHGNFALGVAYFDAYQLDAARKEFESVAARPETRVGANLYLGRLAVREGNLTEAADRLRKAVESEPSSPEPYAELAMVHIRRQEYALAESNLARALKIAPDHYRSNLNLLMLYERTKDSRAEQQSHRVEQLQKAGEERERLLLRSLEIRPY